MKTQTLMKRAACGNCGGEEHYIALADPNGENGIDLQCVACGAITQITVRRPKLEVEMPEDSEGCICLMLDARITRVRDDA